ncbi:MAG: methyltransferase domain-containing protein [Endozoicomonadaceae bacterium]|nr:methyltransferase domain-containing protein [Endozoicomonadaceae bacterium]
MAMKLSDELISSLICPVTKTQLSVQGEIILSKEGREYPIINGVPVLLNEQNSLFSIDQFVSKQKTTLAPKVKKNCLKTVVSKITPSISANLKSNYNFLKLKELLPKKAKILVVGGSIKGVGINCLYENSDYEIIGSDVSMGPHTKLILDAHDIPFVDQTFDCVIAQAVVEHVLDPNRCVFEMQRVLKKGGYIYAETPFMQQVHMGRFDFTRFTDLGHRYLFRNFDSVNSGLIAGPGTALAWSWLYFLRSLSNQAKIRSLLMLFGRFTSFFWKYFDPYLSNKPGAFDAASCLYFMGQKNGNCLSPKQLLNEFRGIKYL